ncbi:hypothetical protein [Nocardia sp. NBC_01329]|uniref:hypothetical protein n=1 Tax=Nocardia sp. NBC_01329 TaxID=2903594 RepID=UPI002E14B601|nr:hypothetical protein OG405_09870 [Nocardia sp. NBC_01329]
MSSIRTTPPRPIDIAAVVPGLVPLARPAMRLHPRPGSPSPHDSSVGGPLLWPADYPWPYCDKWHEGPAWPLVPVAQLYARDVALLRPPGRADLLQVLWCPSEQHPPHYRPPTELFWRTAAEVTDILTAPPTPPVSDYGYVPEPCVLAPEQITEYPNFLDLSEQLRAQLADRSAFEAAGVVVDDYYAKAWEEFYINELSIAPGWKVGGWPRWGLTDPIPRFCIDCGAAMTPLLTIDSCEWDGSTGSWIPYEDQALGDARVANPAKVTISRGYGLQLYVCSKVPAHSHTDLFQ